MICLHVDKEMKYSRYTVKWVIFVDPPFSANSASKSINFVLFINDLNFEVIF